MASPICSDLKVATGKSRSKVMLRASALYKCSISLGKSSSVRETTIFDYYRQTNDAPELQEIIRKCLVFQG